MFPHYDDILSRIEDEPKWFDENGVPRYCDFAPEKSASIYVDEIALAEIECQFCKKLFNVSLSRVNFPDESIKDAIEKRTLHYGDPPNVYCCEIGPPSNSNMLCVIEYWKRGHERYIKNNAVTDIKAWSTWERDQALEVKLGE